MKRNFSSKRNAIYNKLLNTKTHPSAKWVYEQLKPDYPDLSLGTVYRNISLFKEEGTVNVVCNINGEDRIDADTSPHSHFVCNNCGKVIDLEKDIFTTKNETLEELGYKVESCIINFYGKCKDCSK